MLEVLQFLKDIGIGANTLVLLWLVWAQQQQLRALQDFNERVMVLLLEKIERDRPDL